MHIIIAIALFVLLFTRPFISARAYPHYHYLWSCALIITTLLAHARSIILISPSHEKHFFLPAIPRRFTIPLLIIILSYSISSIFTIYPQGSLNALRELFCNMCLMYLVVLFVVTSHSPHNKPIHLIRFLIAACVIPAVFIALYGLHQRFFSITAISDYFAAQNGTRASFIQEALEKKRIFAPFFSSTLLASFFGTILPLTLFLIPPRDESLVIDLRTKISISILCTCIALSLFLTQSVGAWLSLATALLMVSCFWFSATPAARQSRAALIFLVVITLTAIVLTGALVFIRSHAALEVLHPVFSVRQRLYYWQAACKIIAESPWRGLGPGTFAFGYFPYKHQLAQETIFAHNIFLQQWAETGIFGIIGILSLIIMFYYSAARLYRHEHFRLYSLAILTSGTFFLLHNIYDYSLYIPETSYLWWCLIGITIALTLNAKALHIQVSLSHIISVTGILLILSSTVIWSYIRADQGYLAFTRGINGQNSLYNLQKAIAIDPLQDKYYIFLAHALEQTDPAHACTLAQTAVILNPRNPFLWRELAHFYAVNTSPDDAEQAWQQANKLYPTAEFNTE